MNIIQDLRQFRRDMDVSARFAIGGLRARGGRLTAPLKVLDRFDRARPTGVEGVAVTLPGGQPMFVRRGDSDFATVRQVFRENDYSMSRFPAANARLIARYRQLLDEGRKPVIVDAGANVGAAALWFKRCFPEAAIVAVEPDPANAAILRHNLGDLDDAIVLEAAIGARDGFVSLINEEMSWGIRTERAEAGLPIVTVDAALKKVSGGEALIVKIDIEGFESDLFSENTGWIDRTFAIFIEPHDWLLPGQGSSRSFQQAMAQHDFEILLSGENLLYVRG